MKTPNPAPTPTDVIRPEFIAAMRHEIHANARKGDWTRFRIEHTEAGAWLGEHVYKLLTAITAKDRAAVREHAADVANIAMKIDECCGAKQDDANPTPTPRTDAFIASHHAQWPQWDWQDHAEAYADFARLLECELAAKGAATGLDALVALERDPLLYSKLIEKVAAAYVTLRMEEPWDQLLPAEKKDYIKSFSAVFEAVGLAPSSSGKK